MKRTKVRRVSLPLSLAALGQTALVTIAGACSPDWDFYDPRGQGGAAGDHENGNGGDLPSSGNGSSSGIGGSFGSSGGIGNNGEGGKGGEVSSQGGGGGEGGGDPLGCAPGSTVPCYTGPGGTEGVGVCAPGVKVCSMDGQAYGECSGDTTPSAEVCSDALGAPLALDEDCDGVINDHCSIWSKRLGSAGDQLGYSVAADAAGNVYLTGSFTNAITIFGSTLTSAGGTDIFLAKLSAAGDLAWAKRFGDDMDQQGLGIAVDAAGSVVITGSFAGSVWFGGASHTTQADTDVFVAKFATDGSYEWSKGYGDASAQIGRAAAIAPSGAIYVTGEAAGTTSFGIAYMMSAVDGKDIFVVKLSANGSVVWANLFGGLGDDAGLAVAAGAGDAVILGGSFDTSVSFGGQTHAAEGGRDAFAAKLDASGALVFSRSWGGEEDEATTGVAEDAAGNALVAGSFEEKVNLGGLDLVSAGDDDIFVGKFTGAGGHMWSRRLGAAGAQRALGLSLDAAGSAYVTGSMSGTVNFGDLPRAAVGQSDAFVVKLDAAAGDHVWSRSFGDAGSQSGRSIVVDPQGNAVVVGDFSGVLNLGSGSMTSAGGRDVFVANISP